MGWKASSGEGGWAEEEKSGKGGTMMSADIALLHPSKASASMAGGKEDDRFDFPTPTSPPRRRRVAISSLLDRLRIVSQERVLRSPFFQAAKWTPRRLPPFRGCVENSQEEGGNGGGGPFLRRRGGNLSCLWRRRRRGRNRSRSRDKDEEEEESGEREARTDPIWPLPLPKPSPFTRSSPSFSPTEGFFFAPSLCYQPLFLSHFFATSAADVGRRSPTNPGTQGG